MAARGIGRTTCRQSTGRRRGWSWGPKPRPDKQKPPRGPSRPSGAWHSLAEASESTASLVAVWLTHGPTSSGGVRHYRTTPTRSAQLWRARNVADSVFAAGRSRLGPPRVRTLRRAVVGRTVGTGGNGGRR